MKAERASVAVQLAQGGVASLSNKQLFQPDRQLPNADASCVIDCVSNSGRCPDDRKVAPDIGVIGRNRHTRHSAEPQAIRSNFNGASLGMFEIVDVDHLLGLHNSEFHQVQQGDAASVAFGKNRGGSSLSNPEDGQS
jgi:hypothetical protein